MKCKMNCEPNKTWFSDITYIPTTEGWFYLVVVIVLYLDKVVDRSINKRMTSILL
jgi:transposase InsO family protein